MSIQIPPGPRGELLLGNLGQFRRDPLHYLVHLAGYGDITQTYFGPFPVLTVHHPELVHEVLVLKADKFNKPRGMKAIFKDALGNGLLTSDGEFWKRQRRLVQPAFHTRRIAAYAGVMVEHAQRLIDEWRSREETAPGEFIDIAEAMMRLTLGIVAKVLFDADVSSQAYRVGKAIAIGQEITNRKFNSLIRLPRWVPTPDNRRGIHSLRVIDEVVMGIIEERRASGKDHGDLLSMLLMAVDEEGTGGMTNKQVRDEAITLFLAGHDTTANTLTWTWYLLSQHPDAAAKLHHELAAVLGGRAPTFDDLADLPYTEMVIQEALRLYPPAWIVSRQATDHLTLGGYPVKKEQLVFISPYSLHHNPRWFAEPERFIPERFAEGNEESIPKYAYLPFSGGPRICIGNMFALMEARLILATLAQQATMTLTPDHVVEPEPLVTLRPRGGLPMIVTPQRVGERVA